MSRRALAPTQTARIPLRITLSLLAVSVTLLLSNSASGQPGETVSETWSADHDREFDFWVGEWDVLLRTKQPDNSWKDSIHARTNVYRILDGKAILELWDQQAKKNAIRGYSLRHYDHEQGKWILYLNWPGPNQSSNGSLSGNFRHGRGEFFSGSQGSNRTPRISRYTFCDITPKSLRWDDAFSSDGGKTWTNNWIMEFTRTKSLASWPTDGENVLTYYDGARCDLGPFREFEKLAGSWRGEIQASNGDTVSQGPATLTAYKVLDGCAVVSFFEYTLKGEVFKEFSFSTFNTSAKLIEDARLDNRAGTGMRSYFGKRQGDDLVLTSRRTDPTRHRYSWTFSNHDTFQVRIEPLRDDAEPTITGRLERVR